MRNIPDNNLAYPILIAFDTGSTWSWFFLTTDSKKYLVSARHVFFNPQNNNLNWKTAKLICQTQDINDDEIVVFSIDLESANIFYKDWIDVVVIEIWDLLKESLAQIK